MFVKLMLIEMAELMKLSEFGIWLIEGIKFAHEFMK